MYRVCSVLFAAHFPNNYKAVSTLERLGRIQRGAEAFACVPNNGGTPPKAWRMRSAIILNASAPAIFGRGVLVWTGLKNKVFIDFLLILENIGRIHTHFTNAIYRS